MASVEVVHAVEDVVLDDVAQAVRRWQRRCGRSASAGLLDLRHRLVGRRHERAPQIVLIVRGRHLWLPEFAVGADLPVSGFGRVAVRCRQESPNADDDQQEAEAALAAAAAAEEDAQRHHSDLRVRTGNRTRWWRGTACAQAIVRPLAAAAAAAAAACFGRRSHICSLSAAGRTVQIHDFKTRPGIHFEIKAKDYVYM